MFLSEYGYEYLGGGPVNAAFTVGKNYFFIQPFKNGESFFIDDNKDVRKAKDDCFKINNKQVRVTIEMPKFPIERSERVELCKRWEISEPTLKDWFETRPFFIRDAFKGQNSAQLDLSDLPLLAIERGYYWSEMVVRWGYFNVQSVNRMVQEGRRLKMISDAFNGVGK